MPKLTFKTDNITVEVEKGTALIDIAEDSNASLPFGCRDGLCGTCLMTVVEGMENLQPKSEGEEETLETSLAEPDQRLGCQAKINGDIIVENANS